MPWYFIALYITAGCYFIAWLVFAVLILVDGEDGGLNPLSFWRANTRLFYRVVWTAWQVKRIKHRKAQHDTRVELLAEHERQKQLLVEWAFKDPHSFLGEDR